MDDRNNPLVGPPPAEIPLPRAPLVLVVAQVRFPQITSISRSDFVGPFQEAIRAEYPILRREETHDMVIQHGGIAKGRSSAIWRFSEADGPWRVALAEEFVALETHQYSSRDDFISRLERVLSALAEHATPSQADRIGVRYIDRLTGRDAEDLPSLVRPEIAGVLGAAVASKTYQAVSQHLFELEGDNRLLARWGRVPPDRGFADAVPPVDTRSWVLDLDAFRDGAVPFSSMDLANQARELSERIYTFFRWSVTREFIRRFGGEP